MIDLKFEILDINNENDLIQYEKGLYQAFKDDQWICKNIVTIEGDRMRPFIPYERLKVFLAKNSDKILSAFTINPGGLDQLHKFGFTIKQKGRSEEGITMFIDPSVKSDDFLSFMKIFDFGLNDAVERGFQYWYGTCNKKMLTLYKMMGWEVIDQKLVNNKIKYLIEFDIEKNL